MSVDIKLHVEELVPFARKVGIRLEDAAAGEARLCLPHEEGNLGATGALHVGAIFALAEAAAAALGLSAFDPALVTFVERAAEIRYRRPGRGDLWARARLAHDAQQDAMDRATTEGKVDVVVPVEITDQAGDRIADASVTLGLRRA